MDPSNHTRTYKLKSTVGVKGRRTRKIKIESFVSKEMRETTVAADAAAVKPKPTIFVPPRGSMESLFMNGSGPGFSPGPMTMMSGFFSEQSSPFSFSQLLAMASPLAAKPGFLLGSGDCEKEDGKITGESQPDLQTGFESLSPLFMPSSGLSSSCGFLDSPGLLSPLESPFGMSHQQALAHVTAQAVFSQSYMQMQAEFQCSSSTAPVESFPAHSSSPSETLTHQTKPMTTEPDIIKFESSEVSHSDTKGNKPASDGYNWRKYGQKHVKARECPRSYYKCTYINCPVKKIVEQSLDGRISEITYKGHHNHDPPQNTKRGKDIGALGRTVISQVSSDFDPDQMETDRVNEVTNQESIEHQHINGRNDEIQDTTIVLDDRDDDEPAAKRRMMDVGPVSSNQNVIESKIVVQTRSEVDLLDDGFKWRKYGQKVVKGNPHPRSYYRCTYAECNVRKHVERASEDPKAVITTYEGKHNHEIPAGRYSSNGSSQQLQTQKMVPAKSRSLKEMDFVNNDQMPMTRQLKEEQIALIIKRAPKTCTL